VIKIATFAKHKTVIHHFMENSQTLSWMFLALAIASQNAIANYIQIPGVANGINHLLPLQSKI
jgi:hypothetical protein